MRLGMDTPDEGEGIGMVLDAMLSSKKSKANQRKVKPKVRKLLTQWLGFHIQSNSDLNQNKTFTILFGISHVDYYSLIFSLSCLKKKEKKVALWDQGSTWSVLEILSDVNIKKALDGYKHENGDN